MSGLFLYEQPILPKGFSFPSSYVELAKNGLIDNLEPWLLLYNDMATSLSYYGSMLLKYKEHCLIPFAVASDQSGIFNDGYVVLACFDGNDHSGNPKVYFHDYGYNEQYPDWDKRYHLNNFDEWLKLAKEESAQYKAERAESE